MFKLVLQSRSKKWNSRGPWKCKMVTSSRFLKENGGRSQGRRAFASLRVRNRGSPAVMVRYSALNGDLITRVLRVSLQAKISPATACAETGSSTVMSKVSPCAERHLSEAIDRIGWRRILLSSGRTRVKLFIFGDRNARACDMESQPRPFVNLNAMSLGQRGSSVDLIAKKEIVSEETSPVCTFPMDSSITRAAYLVNRFHSLAVGGLVKR